MRKYTWFIEPLDAHTNRVISREIPEEDFQRSTLCADGKRRNLWRCSAQFVSLLRRNKKALNLKFNVFSCYGHSKIRECSFLRKKRKKPKRKKQ